MQGAFTALVTPFSADERLDLAAFESHVQGQIDAGIAGLVPCGTTGESPTLSPDEQRVVIERCVSVAKGRVPVLAGTGSNSTEHAVALARAARDAGADGIMVVMPYYNRPSQEGLLRHVRRVAGSVDAPVVLYNVPSRTAVDLGVSTTLRILEACPNVMGIKDASGNVLFCQELLARAPGRVTIMSGDDALTLPLMSVGARGVISVTSNLLPAAVQQLTRLVENGDLQAARALNSALFPLHRALFSEPSPQPIKGILAARGRMLATVRPPLVQASTECVAAVERACVDFEAKS